MKKPNREKDDQSTENTYLAQMLLCYVGETDAVCGSVEHHEQQQARIPMAQWEIRFYQNIERLVALVDEGEKSMDEINQIVWDETCREQDTIGVIIHKRMHICDECVEVIANMHAGENAAPFVLTASSRSSSAFLLMSVRRTEKTGIVGPLPHDIREKEVVSLLKPENVLSISFHQ